MGYKEVSITVCDDCMDEMDMDRLDDSKRVRRREYAYYTSLFCTMLCMIGLFYWTYTVVTKMDELEGDDYSLS